MAGGDRWGGGSVVPVPPCVVPGNMAVKPFGTTCEEVIGAEGREEFELLCLNYERL